MVDSCTYGCCTFVWLAACERSSQNRKQACSWLHVDWRLRERIWHWDPPTQDEAGSGLSTTSSLTNANILARDSLSCIHIAGLAAHHPSNKLSFVRVFCLFFFSTLQSARLSIACFDSGLLVRTTFYCYLASHEFN